MKKIYFGMNGQFGDIIIQEPTLRKIIKLNPDAEIYMGAYKKYFEILDLYKNYHPNVKQFIKWERYTPRFEKNGDGYWPSKNDKKIIDEIGFDKMYDVAPMHSEQDWVTKRHIVQECGNMYGIDVDGIKVNLKKPEGIVKEKGAVAISLFPSDWKEQGVKSLSRQNIYLIVHFLRQNGYNVYHLAGPGEPDIKNTIKIQGSYIESVNKLLQTEFLITCDTGMSWVSSAYNHPTIGLWGWGTNPFQGTGKNWMPENPNAKYFQSKLANDINMYSVLDEINKRIVK